jgi:hypothetical protein
VRCASVVTCIRVNAILEDNGRHRHGYGRAAASRCLLPECGRKKTPAPFDAGAGSVAVVG